MTSRRAQQANGGSNSAKSVLHDLKSFRLTDDAQQAANFRIINLLQMREAARSGEHTRNELEADQASTKGLQSMLDDSPVADDTMQKETCTTAAAQLATYLHGSQLCLQTRDLALR